MSFHEPLTTQTVSRVSNCCELVINVLLSSKYARKKPDRRVNLETLVKIKKRNTSPTKGEKKKSGSFSKFAYI